MTRKPCRRNKDYVCRFTPETLGLLRTAAPSLSDAMSILLPTSQGDMANCPDQKLNEINLCWSFCERWEPSWEPFAVDCCGRLWTAMDSKAVGSGRYGRLRTAMDGLRPSTDQKVGDSSSSGRARDALYGKGFVACLLMDRMTSGAILGAILCIAIPIAATRQV